MQQLTKFLLLVSCMDEIEEEVQKTVNSFGKEVLDEIALWRTKQNYL